MKKALLFVFLLFTVFSFGQEYKKEWRKVLENETGGEVKKAAALTDIIYKKAKKDKNQPQIIKAFFFKAKYMQIIEEDAQFKIISNIQAEIKTASLPSKAILNSLYAQMLEKIYTKNIYRIRSLTYIKEYNKADYRQWDQNSFEAEINMAYQNSLANPKELYAVLLADFDAIIDFAPSQSVTKRPLYDFLAENYLTYLLNHIDTYYPYQYFDENLKAFFGSTEQFTNLKINDSLTPNTRKAIQLLRDTENHFYAKNDIPNLERAVLRRLACLDNAISNPDKNNVYLATVRKISKSGENAAVYYTARLAEARLLMEMANKTDLKNNYIQALALLEEIIANKAKNDISPEAINLKNTITGKEATIQLEKNNSPNTPLLASIKFKNIDSLSILFYRIPYNANEYDIDFRKLYLTNKKPVALKKYALPQRHDYFSYTTEVILPSLPEGTYAVVITTDGEKLTTENELGIDKIHVSQMTILSQQYFNSNIYRTVNRVTGKPIENINAFAPKLPQQQSGKDGKIVFTAPENYKLDYNKNNMVTFLSGTDTITNNFYLYNSRAGDDYPRVDVKIYLDRHIYRPGQTVYFKAIAYKGFEGTYKVVPNTYFTVTAENERGDEIKKFRLKTNEFGSFNEKVELPRNITGEFSISIDEDDDEETGYDEAFWDEINFNRAETSFNVEEYKRPSFEVTFDKVKEQVKLSKTITVKGFAKALSNAPVANAKVNYKVVRNSKKSWNDYSNHRENIAEGDTITDSNGQFTVRFKAEPDGSYDPKNLPVFTYALSVDITDINGETHSNSYSVSAGYHALSISASLPKEINTTDKPVIELETDNLNGVFTPAKGTVAIYKVAAPERFFTERPWPIPEIQAIPEKEFEQNFPHIPYKKATGPDVSTNAVFSKAVNTAISKELVPDNIKNWKSGAYEMVFKAKDSLGNEVSSTSRFTLQNNTDKVPGDNKQLDYRIINTNYAKDGYVEIELSSGLPLYVNVIGECNNAILFDELHELNTTKKKIRIPAPKNPLTPISFLISYVWQGQYYSKSFSAIVPRKMEQLFFETQTMSSKLSPGVENTWSFSLKGSKQQAEVLASMYDASLDRLTDDDYSYRINRWDWLDTNSYRSGQNSLHMELLTNGTTTVSFYETLKNVMLTKSSDTFYQYGFVFDSPTSSYYAYMPKNRIREKNDFVIDGTVTDSEGIPIPGVNVVLEGSSEGTQTDIDGNYSIYAPKGTRLVYSFVGMITQTRTVQDTGNISISLQDDATLLRDVVVEAYRTTTRATSSIAVTTVTSKIIEGRPNANFIQTLQGQVPGLQISTASGQPGAASTVILRGIGSINGTVSPLYVIDGVPLSDSINLSEYDIADISILKDAGATSIYGNRGANGVIIINTKKAAKEIAALQQVKARKNFNETAFFYPQLLTDKKGNISFSFTAPEALTEWKLRLFAHNKNAASANDERLFFTQKELMIVPNMPRFLREKDTITLVAKVTNLTPEAKNGNALLQLFDAVTMEPVDAKMLNVANMKPFSLTAKGNTTVSWTITVPKGLQGVQYKVLAKAGDFTDGEENILPVLTNAIQVTESIPLWVKPNATKEYSFERFKESFGNANINQIGLTLEYTSNPAWLALQSLPYLMEFEHECAEQVFSRFYANAIASDVIESNPKIAEVFAAWRKSEKPLSKFEQNEQLKSIVMAETPWILENQSSEEIKSRLALLFDLDKMENSLESAFTKLQNKQQASGGFAWFEGGSESIYITRHIAAGFGHLNKIGIALPEMKAVDVMTQKAVAFMDTDFLKRHESQLAMIKNNRAYVPELRYDGLHYLYARSFYLEKFPMSDSLQKIVVNYINSMNKSTAYDKMKWLSYSLYQKGMAALIMHRFGYTDAAKKIVNHLKETSSTNEDSGMYWIENKAGYYWYQAPVETQALLIEAFLEIDKDTSSADAMKVWLLKNKQNKNWPSTKATAEAVYALLMQGGDWLSVKESTTFSLGDKQVPDTKINENEKEAGTGYMKLQWKPEEMKPDMGTLKVKNASAVAGFGGFYWQRSYEQPEKDFVPADGVLNVTKELYTKNNTPNGPVLEAVKNKVLKIGDLITIRLVITAKEDMEYLHLKDMRASAFEPVDVLSERKYKGGISYYQSTRDAATNFFFDSLQKGVYVIEYDVRVNNAGDFSNGIATIQSMYAPEFSGNSKSMRLHIE